VVVAKQLVWGDTVHSFKGFAEMREIIKTASQRSFADLTGSAFAQGLMARSQRPKPADGSGVRDEASNR
jgi:hypothetical protein